MAIVTEVQGLEVTIQSPDVDLPEYEDDAGEWKYKKFGHLSAGRRSVKYPFRLDSPSLTFKATVDGHGIAQATCSAEYLRASFGMYMEIMSNKLERISPTEVSSRSLKFSRITKVDDTDSTRVRADAKLVASIGEIVISVFRTQQVAALPAPGNFTPSPYQPPTEVSEKALKGKSISTAVAYGEQQIVHRVSRETIDLDGPNNPIAVFIFKYRTRQDLKAEMIIPRSPSPEPVRNPFARRSNNTSATISKEARLANLKREIAQIKAEEEDQPKGCKRDADGEVLRSGRAYKTTRRQNGAVVVDLTDD